MALSLKLLELNLYHVGTVRTNRLGWCNDITYKCKKRPKNVDRGTYRIAECTNHPELVALSWMDSRPVNFLATGCSTVPTSVMRKEKTGAMSTVKCPELVVDYHKGMGGVDVHDQLRLQRYSVQKCIKYRKYYKTLFLGLVDMALINGYIIHRISKKQKGEKYLTHAEYMRRLHVELLGLEKRDMLTNANAEDLVSEPVPTTVHALRNTNEMYTTSTQNKRRQYQCKVCSVLTEPKKKSYETSYVCDACDEEYGGRVALCNKIRRVETGNTLTCSQIWHTTWNGGKTIPAIGRSRIRFRKRKRDDAAEQGTG